MSDFIGVVRSATTGEIFAVINPDDDSELNNPRWLLIKRIGATDAVELIKVPRGDYMGAMTTEQLAELVQRLAGET
jgi:hypothetical protein